MTQPIQLNPSLTEQAVSKASYLLTTQETYSAAKTITREFLGARQRRAHSALFGFWVPGLVDGALKGKSDRLTLELFTVQRPFDFRALKRGETVDYPFQRTEIQLAAVGDYLIGVVDHVTLGDKETLGTLYWLRYADAASGRRFIIRDPLVQSAPFGIYAPAELFDIDGMLSQRKDMDFFTSFYKTIYPDGSYRARDVGAHLEIHTETATGAGTVEALTAVYQTIAQKMQANIDAGAADIYATLSPAELNFVGFDSIELTPEVPPSERESIRSPQGEFFRFDDAAAGEIKVQVKRPDISNWGYDTPIVGSAAVNPSILGSLRPNEFLEFIETLHTMPGRPIQMCIDSVLGHCDFQGAYLLQTFDVASDEHDNPKYINSAYLRGPNMYGRDIDFSHPNVKAIILELLIRKLNLGYDCVRVDGAQDFILGRDEDTGLRIQDDQFLNEMANVVQEINGLKRRLDFNLEDGRPWPDDLNWLYNSKYLDHTIERTLPFGDRVKQWSPIIFAHNVHGKYKWFMNKWDRFVEVFRYGADWITGHSNHDNARYFYRLVSTTPSSLYRPGDSFDDFYNDQLGETLKTAAHNAMNSNALTALSLAFLPGNPMFLLNALFRTPWLFMRDIDDTYAVKIVSDEGSRYMTWYVDADLYARADSFQRLKRLGFTDCEQLVAHPADKKEAPGFMDVLFELGQAVKTDALMVRYLFDDPEEAGGFGSVQELRQLHKHINAPQTVHQHERVSQLQRRANADPRETERRVLAARKMLRKNLRFLERDKLTEADDIVEVLVHQIEKISYLEQVSDADLALLLEEADLRSEYNVETWARHKPLNATAPPQLKENGRLSPATLKRFANAFMLDARDAAKVNRYVDQLDPDRVGFNFELRRFRQANPWLLANPTNDVQKDYFARKLFINGAKDVGDWGDKGDVVKCNTIYYGWRTSPEGRKQVFFIGNMEGKPLDRLPLNLFLNLGGEWRVAAKSPTLEGIPDTLDKSFVIEDFKNGEALVLERDPS